MTDLPPGFELEKQSAGAQLPPGFELEQITQAAPDKPLLQGGPVNLPYFGKPSLIGLAKGLFEGVKSAVTLPSDVYQGKVDPLSDEGLSRARDLAQVGSPLSPARMVVQRAAAGIKPQELLDTGAAGFKEARASGAIVDPQAVLSLVDRTRTKLADEGMPRSLAGGVHDTLNELKGSAEAAIKAGQPISANDLVAYRQTLTGHTKTPTSNSAAGGMAKSIFDDWLKTEAPTLSPVLQDAVANFRIGKLAEDVTNKQDRATYGAAASNSGMNIENKLRQSLVGIVSDSRKLSRYSPEVQQLMKDVVNGTKSGNLLRDVGNRMGGGGGVVPTMASLALGHFVNPALAAIPLAGYGLKTIGNRATLGKFDQIAQQAMANSPYARGLGPRGPLNIGSRPTQQLPPVGANLLGYLNYPRDPYQQ